MNILTTFWCCARPDFVIYDAVRNGEFCLKNSTLKHLTFGVAVCLGSIAVHTASASELPPSSGVSTCESSASDICWWVDSRNELHGARSEYPGKPLPPGLEEMMQKRYAAMRARISATWSVAARSVVSDIVHTDLQTLATAGYQVSNAWTDFVRVQTKHDNDAAQGITLTVAAPVVSVVSYSTFFTTNLFFQNVIAQILSRYVLPGFLSSSGYSWTDIPNEISTSIYDLKVSQLNDEIGERTQALISKIALEYLDTPNGEKSLARDSLDQAAQLAKLTAIAGLPLQLGEAMKVFKESRDTRLMYAAKLATVLDSRYSEMINSFIVTGYFGELELADSGVSVAGAVFDLYLAPGEPAFETQSMGIPLDNRRKRHWSINGRGLQAEDHGRFMEGRLFDRAYLLLPYWDEPVKPASGDLPVLKGRAGLPLTP